MGRKFIGISANKKTHRMFLIDIRMAYKKIKRTIPKIPTFRDDTLDDDLECSKESTITLKSL